MYEKINTLRRDIEMLKSERDQKLGEIKSLNDRLRHDFGIEGGIEGAKRKIKAFKDTCLICNDRYLDF